MSIKKSVLKRAFALAVAADEPDYADADGIEINTSSKSVILDFGDEDDVIHLPDALQDIPLYLAQALAEDAGHKVYGEDTGLNAANIRVGSVHVIDDEDRITIALKARDDWADVWGGDVAKSPKAYLAALKKHA